MTSSEPIAREMLYAIRGRALDAGGFSILPGGGYRPDATAWATLALAAGRFDGHDDGPIESSRTRLAADQQDDGRISISPSHPESFWPTALAILAWGDSPVHAEAHSRAVSFLLSISGRHWDKVPESPMAHDTSLRGWPWTEATHSWVEPTSMAILALKSSGHGHHERVKTGLRMIMDRQLPSGGWNYGNTLVYGRELHPQPDVTGIALNALAGFVPEHDVKGSLRYLNEIAGGLKTPLSLGWTILGLGAWGRRPRESDGWIAECVKRQERVGTYDTTLLSLLFLAWMFNRGMRDLHPAGDKR